MQLNVKTLLNAVHPIEGFVYQDIRMVRTNGPNGKQIRATIRPRGNAKPRCSLCKKPGAGYDKLPERSFHFVPLWAIPVILLYRPRRVDCRPCGGVHVEDMPWAQGKSPLTKAMMCFLATWARRLSWTETARVFQSSWDYVCKAVEWVVDYGLAHRDLSGITAIGVDEISYKKDKKFITLVYQIDIGYRRLLWIGEGHTKKTLEGFFKWFGKRRTSKIRFVCSDMWKGFLSVIKRRATNALHILDKFHIVANLNKAVDETRRQEAAAHRREGNDVTLKHTRWCLLKRVANLTRKQKGRLKELLKLNLRTVRAYLLKEEFSRLWGYRSVTWAGKFLDRWCEDAVRSQIEPMKRQAKTLREHRELILNYFRALKEFSSAAVEGLNNKAKVVIRKSFGFRAFGVLKIALFHTLGHLPEPEQTHKFA